MRIVIAALLLFCLPFNSYGFNPKYATLEEKMVFLNTDTPVANVDPIKVNRVRYLLDKLQSRHPETRQNLADLTVKAQGVLASSGIRESLIEIMESMNSVKIDPRIGRMTYKDLVTAYVTVRADGMSRKDAVRGLFEFLRGVGRLKN